MLSQLGIDYDEVVRLLEDQGVAAFTKAWNSLLDSVEASLTRLRGPHEAR
jgi:transaldolase